MQAMLPRNPYQILGISSSASDDEIKHAYRAMVLKWHPDRHQNDKDVATNRFIEINNAYKELALHFDLESDFQEPFVMPASRTQASPHRHRTPSISSTDSASSMDSYIRVRAGSLESESRTTPSSSFNETHPKDRHPQSAAPPASHHRNHRQQRTATSQTYENWRAGSDLPDTFRRQPYERSRLPHVTTRPAVSSKPTPHHPETYSRQVPRVKLPRVPHESTFYSILTPKVPKRDYGRQFTDHLGMPAQPPPHSPPYDIPLTSIGLGPSGEWAFSLPLTLEELFAGKHCRFVINRKLLSGRCKKVTLELDIPPGCRAGTRVLCRKVGHEKKIGTLQDIAFIIDEETHHGFKRLFDDLIMDIRIPWVDSLRRHGGEVPVASIDGRTLAFFIDYPRYKCMKGRSVIRGAGMPAREGGRVVGRGDLVIQWEILPAQTRVMHFVKRLLNHWK